MAIGNVFKDTFGKVKNKLEGFLYHEDGAAMSAPPPSMSDESYAPPAESYPQQPAAPAAYAYQQPAYQAGYPGQQSYYQQPGFQQPLPGQQPTYQAPAEQPQQPVYQAPAAPQSSPFTRNRRAERTPQRQENNVVDFSAYQQAQPDAAPAQPQATAAAAASARIINARSMADCRSAITLLRNGDTVLIVLENISDPSEMRRLVDTLSGACYSLTATITKVSRAGVYLLAPQSMAVYEDQLTNQLNMAPTRMPVRPAAAGYGAPQAPQRAQFQAPVYQQPYQQNQPQQAGMFTAPQNGFMQRAAAPQEAPAQPFYTRQPAQNAQLPAFSSQPAGYGYSPDESEAAEQ